MTPAQVISLLWTLLFGALIAYKTLTSPGDGMSLPFTDKQLHALAFAALVLPIGWFRPAWAVWVAAGALAFGAAIEVIQPAVGRTGEWGDLIADGVGIILGLLPGQLKRRVHRARRLHQHGGLS